MGISSSQLFASPPTFRILMLGLDASGKTTILYETARPGKVGKTFPTIGFNVESIRLADVLFTVWDVSGHKKLRSYWRDCYANTDGLIYVVDSANRERFEEARAELFDVLSAPALEGVPLVIFANKKDLPGAATVAELEAKLQLYSVTDRKCFIHSTVAASGEGVKEGFSNLANNILQTFKG